MDDRRALIADSALRVIGAGGMRALTHAAVDAEAGLPKGSTSYYCRKRIDLLRLTLQRLYAIDHEEISTAADAIVLQAPLSATDVAWAIAGIVEGWLSTEYRSRTRAKFELFLAVAHEEDLRDLQHAHLRDLLAVMKQVADAIDPPSAMEHVATTLMLADGLMINVIRQGLPSPPRSAIAELMAIAIGTPLPERTGPRFTSPVLEEVWGE